MLTKADLERLASDAKSGGRAVPVMADELAALVSETLRLRRSHRAVKHTIVCDGCGWACYLEDEHPESCPVCGRK